MFRIRHPIRHLALAAALLGIAQQAGAVTVGNEAACNFHTLNDAINSVPRGGSVSIRLSNNVLHDPLLSIDRNVTIIGGYDNCTDGTANHLTPSTISGIGNNQPVVHLSGLANPIAVDVSLTNVNIANGSAPNGAGIRISADNRVTLSNVQVYGNEASVNGGGVYIDGSKGAELIIDHDSQIWQNSAHQKGGGIYCVDANAGNGSKIDFRRGDIHDNLAGAFGAGLYLDACHMTGSTSGLRRIGDNFTDKTAFDDADTGTVGDASGGGLFATDYSFIQLGSPNSETLVEGNHVRDEIINGFGTHYEEDHGNGGGLFLELSAEVELTNAHLANNIATDGAGVMALTGGRFELRRDPAGCILTAGYRGCASIEDNTAQGWDRGFDGCLNNSPNWAGRGGALQLATGSGLLDGVWVTGNRAVQTDGCAIELHKQWPHGAAFMLRSGARLDVINTVIHDNGNNSADDIIHVDGGSTWFRAFHSTIGGNSNVDDAVIRTSSGEPTVELFNSIVMEATAIYKNDGATDAVLRSVCVLTNNLGTLDDAPQSDLRDSVQAGNAGFVDGNSDDFRLQNNSPAVDLCTADEVTAKNYLPAAVRDLEGDDRPRIAAADTDRAWDAGAYENQTGLAAIVGDLEVSIDDGGFHIGLNSSMGYLITLQNNGPDPVANAGFRVTLDAALQNAMTLLPFANGWSCSNVGHVGECQYSGALLPGAEPLEVAVQFTSPSSPAIVTSTVEALGPATLVDAVTTNNSASEITSIATDSDLAAHFLSVPSVLEPGATSQVTVELDNLGPDVSPQPKIRLFFPDTVQNVSVLNKPSTAWSCTDAVDQGNGTSAITCSANQAAPTTYEFTFGFQLPINQPAPSLWAMRLVVVQESPEPIADNLVETSVPVEVLSGGPVIFRGDFED